MITEKEYKDHLDEIVECHLVLGGLQELKYNHTSDSKIERAIVNNLCQLSQHAGEKRLGMGQVYHLGNILALCQYEFMLKKMLPYIISENEVSALLKLGMTVAIDKIKEVRDIWGVPAFKEKDEIMIVEVYIGEEIKAIEPEKLKKYQ